MELSLLFLLALTTTDAVTDSLHSSAIDPLTRQVDVVPPPPSCSCRCDDVAHDGDSDSDTPPPAPQLEILTYDAPCILATHGIRFGLINEEYPAVPVWDKWTPVMGDDIPLSDAQLAWLAGNEKLAHQISEGMEARGSQVFAGMLGAGIGVATSMVGWTLFGAAQFGEGGVSPQVSLPIGLGGLVVAVVGVLYTTYALQAPLEPFLTPTPSHMMTRQEAYDMIQAVNARRDRLLCAEEFEGPDE